MRAMIDLRNQIQNGIYQSPPHSSHKPQRDGAGDTDYAGDISQLIEPSDFTLNRHHTDIKTVRTHRHLKPAAILLGIVEYEAEPKILLTRRADHLQSHSGQIAFPGGKVDKTDGSPSHTALREAAEEIGLQAADVEIAGYLDLYETVTGYCVQPVIGFIRPDFNMQVNPHEVAEVFEIPVSFLMNRDNHKIDSAIWRRQKRFYYAIQYKEHYIWGATAGMLRNFCERVF